MAARLTFCGRVYNKNKKIRCICMKKRDFYYDLPGELIAQEPIEPRDQSRMLVLDRKTGSIRDSFFYRLVEFLNPGDCLILNDSRVLPARLYGVREDTGGVVEILLLNPKGGNRWEVLAGPAKKAKPQNRLIFGDGLLKAEVVDVLDGGNRLVEFYFDTGEGSFYSLLEQIGEMPLPHYITKRLDNPERYQTVYSREPGSAAAPTAGLHFTPKLLSEIRDMGVGIGFVTLHVGLGTFRPVKTKDIKKHRMHSEHYEMPAETADLINSTRSRGGRVIAVGTTSCRTIESVGLTDGKVKPGEGWTDIFIYPGYEFKVTNGLITNFHLPESTLIMLVSAFAGHRNTMSAYDRAVKEKYRFYSFGDSMLII